MKIHKDLLTHDGKALVQNKADATLVGKAIDLGFNGDFDHKKSDWNMLFVQCDGGSGDPNSSLEVTMKVYSAQTLSGDTDSAKAANMVSDANLIGSAVIPADVIKNGGVTGIPMPSGLKRYFTINFTTSNHSVGTTAAKLTAGITDEVDTDTRFNWTNYKAQTGSSALRQRSDNVGEVVDGTVHAAITT